MLALIRDLREQRASHAGTPTTSTSAVKSLFLTSSQSDLPTVILRTRVLGDLFHPTLVILSPRHRQQARGKCRDMPVPVASHLLVHHDIVDLQVVQVPHDGLWMTSRRREEMGHGDRYHQVPTRLFSSRPLSGQVIDPSHHIHQQRLASW